MAGDWVHVFGEPSKMLVWRRMMAQVFFGANHMGIYPAASMSLRVHNRLDSAVANSSSATSSTIICNNLISVITDSSGFSRWPAPSGLYLCGFEWPQCDTISFLSKTYLSILSKHLHCWQDGDSLVIGLVRPITMSEPVVEAILLLKTDCSLFIICASDCRKQKINHTFHVIFHFQPVVIIKWHLITSFAF